MAACASARRHQDGSLGVLRVPGAESHRPVEEAKADLAALPESDKVAGFDDVAHLVASLPAALAKATPEQVKALVRLVVESVETRVRGISRVVIVPAARPFFADDDLLMAPPDGAQPLAAYA